MVSKLHPRVRSQPISQQQPSVIEISMRTSTHSVVRSPEGEGEDWLNDGMVFVVGHVKPKPFSPCKGQRGMRERNGL